jgi:threonine dehydratase
MAMPTLADIHGARERIADAVVVTPLVAALALRDRVPGPRFLKLETRGPEHVRDVVRTLEQHGFGVRQD